ncbi:MAG TPA: hypothetical protein VES96_05030 [Nitrospiraceae bacterium]|nr:hypothetical protein [Nitrospiraceae bacterium]
MTSVETRDAGSGARWQRRFADAVRFVVAPVILFVSGFSTADFALSGVYTWPRTSRVLVLTITIAVLAYEFVYKEQRTQTADASGGMALKAVVFSCLIPYALGIGALIALSRM